jgi:fluoride exporter
MMLGRELLAVVVGGMIGAGLRFGIDTALPHDATAFPPSTLIVNVLGSAALGFLVARLWPTSPSWLRAGLGTGLLGSFTTFSAFAVSLVELGPTPAGIGYLVLSLVLGPGAAFAGLRLGSPKPTTMDEATE